MQSHTENFPHTDLGVQIDVDSVLFADHRQIVRKTYVDRRSLTSLVVMSTTRVLTIFWPLA